MKKSKLTLGIAFSAMACTLLAGCNEVKYSPDGSILTYKNSAGEVFNYTAEDLFGSYYEDSSKVSTMFDSVYKTIVRNYFTKENAGYSKYSEILKNSKNDVEGVKSKAQENANTNSTSYDDEWNALLSSYSCKDEAELLEHFIYERELKEFNDQFYDNNIELLRDSKPTVGNTYEGYLYNKLPYHVRHILVKISDTGSTNFWNGTIDSSDAIQLYDVASSLAAGAKSFGKIAQEYSDDTSASSFGDLGIMDKDTSFVNEFKLGVYAFENIYNNATKASAESSNIAMSGEIKHLYQNATETNVDEIAKIPYGVFLKLNEVNDLTKDEKNRDVNDGNANFFPRNVYFNKYLNKHAVAVVTPEGVEGQDATSFPSLPGFNFSDSHGDGLGNILRTSDGLPVLVSRAGTSDYQGIHFIVVERTPLVDEVADVKLSEYYTTFYPGQSGKEFPHYADGSLKQTYVNFFNQETKDYKTRAESVQSKIKDFDKDLNKLIFSKYLEEEKISFKDEKLKTAIETWILNSKIKKLYDDDIAWEKTWNTYIQSLSVQKIEREKLIPEACAIGFKTHTGADWEDGGQCYDNKNR